MRTKNSLKNIFSMIFFNLLVGILGFIKVKVFVNGLSNDVYSLNQLFYQIFSYMTIADVGFGLILNQKLYQAFAKEDKTEVNKIFSTSKKFYKILGNILIFATVVISFFIHLLTKANVSNLYIQIVFIIFTIRNVIDYYFIAPRYVMEADQKSYKINHLVKSIKILETIIEIILVLLGIDYLLILIPGIIINLVVNIYINNKVQKEYSWLSEKEKFNPKYLSGTKDLIYIKLAGLMNSNTDIILLSTFVNPISVIIYTSYTYITKFVSDTIYIVANSITPSFANVICKETSEKAYNVFCELNIMFLFIAGFVSVMFYTFLNPLIGFWVGKEYIIGSFVLALFCIITFQNIASRAITITIHSKALFKETKIASIFETILNLVISVTLIFKLGLSGVLLGTIISYTLTTFIQNAYYIYKYEFKKNPFHYFIEYISVIIMSVTLIILFSMIHINITNVLLWLIYVIVSAVIVGLIMIVLYMLLFKSFRALFKRGFEFIKTKGTYLN